MAIHLGTRRELAHGTGHGLSSIVQPPLRGFEGGGHAVLDQQAAAGAVDAPHVAPGLEVPVGNPRPREDLEPQLGQDLGNDVEEACPATSVDPAADPDQRSVVAAPSQGPVGGGPGALELPGQHGLAAGLGQQSVQMLERSHRSS